jgi:hypothetical protein
VRLVTPNGRLISNSLSMFHLFSFDVADKACGPISNRSSGAYATKISKLTAKLLAGARRPE